jgi:hypothetical protein
MYTPPINETMHSSRIAPRGFLMFHSQFSIHTRFRATKFLSATSWTTAVGCSILCAELALAQSASVSVTAVNPTAQVFSAPTAAQLFNWAETMLPSVFPAGAKDKTLTIGGITYTLRSYISTNNHLAVNQSDGTVLVYGMVTNNQLLSLGTLSNFTCDVNTSCALFKPDADGNMGAGFARLPNITAKKDMQLLFEGLGPNDQLIEVNDPTLTGTQLCMDSTLPTGAAHPVVTQKPLPLTHYAAHELSGPYRTYPAGIYPMSGESGECGLIEKTTPCLAPNEYSAGAVLNTSGSTDYLCKVTPYLMSAVKEGDTSTHPPTPNPACIKGKTLDSTWSDPANQGVFLRLSWKDVNPSYGVYDWSILDREFIAAMRNGKTIMVGVEVGGNSIPDWVFDSGDPSTQTKAQKLLLRDWGTQGDSLPNEQCGFQYTVASPSDATFKTLFKKVLADMGSHIRSDQRKFSTLIGVKVTGLGMATLENRLPARCNIARPDPAKGDTGTQGHLLLVQAQDPKKAAVSVAPSFDPKYASVRIKDVSTCVCNPQVLAYGGYTPNATLAFYDDIEATLLDNFGYKQQIFMNVTSAFPQVGEVQANGKPRFLGDHLVGPITSYSIGSNGKANYTTDNTNIATTVAVEGSDIPDSDYLTKALVQNGRNGVFAGNDSTKAKAFGVENAALDVLGFTVDGSKCSQDAGVANTGTFAGSANFPIASGKTVDATGTKCPNWVASKEGIAFDKVTGFQVVAGLQGAEQMDSALWNMTLNTNGLFFELYESNAWRARKEAALNANEKWVADTNATYGPPKLNAMNVGSPVTTKSGAEWNQLLLDRASTFSNDSRHNNLFQTHPFPSGYTVPVGAITSNASRWFFNSRACMAFVQRGTPVRINRVDFVQ